MHWGGTAEWLGRAGLVLQFISVFMVTPEILGAERLRLLQAQVVARTREHQTGIRLLLGAIVTAAAFLAIALLSNLVEIRLEGSLGVVLIAAVVYVIVSRSNRLAAWLLARSVRYAEKPHSYIPIGVLLFVIGFALDLLSTFF